MLEFAVHVANVASMFVILTISLNLLVGYTGLFTVTHGALYGVGAYTAALVAIHLRLPLPLTVAAAIGAASLVGAIVALPSLRVSGDYLVIASLGLQVFIESIFRNADAITGGTQGLPGIPQPALFGWHGVDPLAFLPLSLIALLLTLLVAWLITSAPFGLALKSIREDEIAAASLGKNTVRYKVQIFVVASGIAGGAGTLYAYYLSFIDPSSFTIDISILVFSMVVVGGVGTLRGSVCGAILLIVLGESLRFLNFPNAVVGQLRQASYGLALIAFMFLRPQGLLGEATLGRVAHRSPQGQLPEPKAPEPITSPYGKGGATGEGSRLRVEGLIAGYGSHVVLRGVSLEVGRGEIVVIVGHNGAGKSTLLSSIVGLIRVQAGRVFLDGEDITNRQNTMPAERRIGLVPQTGGVFTQMTVAENLQMAGYLRRRDPARLRKQIQQILELFPVLASRQGQKAGTLSGGQQRSLALAMGLVPEHSVLLLDEPSVGLSPNLVRGILASVKQISRDLGVTVLLNEQNVRPALEIADRAYVLKTGLVHTEGSARNLLNQPDLWRLF